MKKKGASEMLTGKPGKAGRLNLLLPEDEYRYLYAILTEHNPVSQTGRETIERLLNIMGKTLDKWNSK